jgi:hypothetical protein
MGKLPGFYFFPADWSRDLEEHPLEIEGAWIRILCKLHYAGSRGSLTRTIDQWARILRVDTERAADILEYVNRDKIGTVTITGENVTVENRRMRKEDKIREQNRIRKKRERERRRGERDVTQAPRQVNINLNSSKKEGGNCIPVQAVVDSYHKQLSGLPKVRKIGKHLERNIRARWKENKELQDLAGWVDLFKSIRSMPWLMGEVSDFRASLGWIVGPKNFEKIANGQYIREKPKATARDNEPVWCEVPGGMHRGM